MEKYSFEEKRIMFGEGPWCNEPDLVEFESHGLHCLIRRMIVQETENHWFGGFLNGYVRIPKDHKLYEKDYNSMNFDVHGGLTYSGYHEDISDDDYYIGFDCAHSTDMTPSMEKLYNTDPAFIEIRKKYKKIIRPGLEHISMLYPTYKDIEYVKSEVINLSKQVSEYGGD